jgi:hypothetical protein
MGGLETYEVLKVDGESVYQIQSQLPDPGPTQNVLKLGEVIERIWCMFYNLKQLDIEQSVRLISTVESNLHNLLVFAENSEHRFISPASSPVPTPHPYRSWNDEFIALDPNNPFPQSSLVLYPIHQYFKSSRCLVHT